MLQIRKAEFSDAESIAFLGRTTFRQAFGHLFRDKTDLDAYLEKTFALSKIKSSLKKEENLYYLALWNNKAVAYAKLKLNSSSPFLNKESICQLQKIYVLEEYLSRKIGLDLQTFLLRDAINRGFKSVWLSVWEGNAKAIAFYNRSGFEKIGEHHFQIGKENFLFHAMAIKEMKAMYRPDSSR